MIACTCYVNLPSDATKRTSYLGHNYCISSQCPALPSLIPFYSPDILRWHLLNPRSLGYIWFSYRPSSLVILIVSIPFQGHKAVLRPSSALRRSVFRFLSLGGYGPPHHTIISLGRRIFWPWLPVTRWRQPPLASPSHFTIMT